MLGPNGEVIETGGDTQINTEQAPGEPMNLSDAGRAFFDTLSTDGNPQEIAEPWANQEEEPTPGGDVILDNETPVATEGAVNAQDLEAIKQSILAEIQSLKQDADSQGQGDLGEIDEGSEEPDFMSDDDFMERFSENPMEAVAELSNKIADEKVKAQMQELSEKMKPLLDQSEQMMFQEKVKEVLAEFAGMEEYADATDFFPQMAETIKAQGLPQDDINTYIGAYKDAALQDARANKGKSLEDYMNDESSLSQITGNPQIREAIIKEYLNEIAGGGKPQVISGGGSASPAATPPNEFKTFEDARKAFKHQL